MVTLKLGGNLLSLDVPESSYVNDVFCKMVIAQESLDTKSIRTYSKVLRSLVGRDQARILTAKAFDVAFKLS